MRPFCLLASLSLSALALADSGPGDLALIEDSGAAYRGALSVNQAAGQRHQQINGRILAIGDGAAGIEFRQRQALASVDLSVAAQASIRGAAFAHGSGVLGVNQASGHGSQQINALRASVGALVESVDDSILAQQSVVLAQDSGTAESRTGVRSVDTDNRAFAGSSGVVQLNQSAGVGNRMANTISIRVMDRP
ncbi:adhesin [Pseudomonas stutzeri]|nr:adhesin [Stutzerimonas stutzeri]